LLMVASIYDTIFLSLWQEIFLDFSKNPVGVTMMCDR